MFKAGYGAGGRDPYDATTPLYRAVASMVALRKSERMLSRGTPTVLAANAAQPGPPAWRRAHDGETARVVFYTAEGDSLLAGLDTGLPEGTVLRGLFGLAGRPGDQNLGRGGRVTLTLAARSGQVCKATAQRAVLTGALPAAPPVTLTHWPPDTPATS